MQLRLTAPAAERLSDRLRTHALVLEAMVDRLPGDTLDLQTVAALARCLHEEAQEARTRELLADGVPMQLLKVPPSAPRTTTKTNPQGVR